MLGQIQKMRKIAIEGSKTAGHRWFKPVILATQEAQIKRIPVQSQLEQILCKTLPRRTLHKNRAGGVVKVKTLGSSPSNTHIHTHTHTKRV
jgi:hypothetical protein